MWVNEDLKQHQITPALFVMHHWQIASRNKKKEIRKQFKWRIPSMIHSLVHAETTRHTANDEVRHEIVGHRLELFLYQHAIPDDNLPELRAISVVKEKWTNASK